MNLQKLLLPRIMSYWKLNMRHDFYKMKNSWKQIASHSSSFQR